MTVGQYILTLVLLIFVGVLVIFIRKLNQNEEYEFFKSLNDPDGILCLTETRDGPLKANFVLCISLDELLSRNKVIFEVRQLPMDSQENQDT